MHISNQKVEYRQGTTNVETSHSIDFFQLIYNYLKYVIMGLHAIGCINYDVQIADWQVSFRKIE